MRLVLGGVAPLLLALMTAPYVWAESEVPENSEAALSTQNETAWADSIPPQETWDAIRESTEKYVTAYNRGDAEAIGNLYTELAELIDSSGTAFRGRSRIIAEYRAFFEAHPQAHLSMTVEDVRSVAPGIIIETGTTESQLDEDQSPSPSRYVAVHVKEGEDWRLASVRDEEIPATAGSNLEQLSWLIGRWIDEAPDSMMEIDCYWHESGSYLIRDFRIKVEGLIASNGTERIGWDPVNKQVRSWLFDSEGGFLKASWLYKDGTWTVTATGAGSDGSPLRATYLVTPLREDAYHMHSFNRTAGDEDLEDIEMTVVRRPPQPGDVTPIEAPSSKSSEATQE